MLTIHASALLLPGGGLPPVRGGAVAVEDAVIAAFGPYEELAAAHPSARVRRWPGLLTPGLVQRHAVPLLEGAYFPDPREADEMGTAPVTGEAAAVLLRDDTRRAGSVRRGVHRMLRHGTTAAVADAGAAPALLTAVRRSGLMVLSPAPDAGRSPEHAPDASRGPRLDPLAGVRAAAEAMAAPLEVGGRADLAAFDAPDEPALLEAGAACCVATVAAGRLVHRGR